jgi:magnesium chelatase family protein
VSQEKEKWLDLPKGESSPQVRERVCQAWVRQQTRQGSLNARLSDGALDLHCAMTQGAKTLLERLIDRYYLSARSIQRVRRVARTVADLEADMAIDAKHVAEAFQYRFKAT